MPRNTVVYDLLISCPGDITGEIAIIDKVVDEFNRYTGAINGVTIQTRHWSKDSFPQAGDSAQGLLFGQFIDECDAAVALFWTRFGTPTDEYLSGTEAEIDKMINSKKQVFLYFSDKPISPSSQDRDQYDKVVAFKERYSGLYSSYSSDSEFEKFFRIIFFYTLSSNFPKPITNSKKKKHQLYFESFPSIRRMPMSIFLYQRAFNIAQNFNKHITILLFHSWHLYKG